MKYKNKWKFKILILIIVILVLSTAGFAMKNASSNYDSKKDMINSSNSYDKPKDSVQEMILTQNKMEELYNKGYGVRDIEKATELASKYGKSIDEILKMKGPKDYKYKAKNAEIQSTPQDSLIIDDTSMDWNEVIADLSILKNVSGDKEKELETQLNNLRRNGRQLKGEELKESRDLLAKDLIKKYDIKNSDIEKCKEAGINELEEVSYVKKLVLYNNSTIEKVLALKKKKSCWSEVEKSLGGEKK